MTTIDPEVTAGMARIPGGTFRRGSDQHYLEEKPGHQVSVGAFWMDAHTVTTREFERFVAATGHVSESSISDLMDHPVVHVAFEDAEGYAKWAGKERPRRRSGNSLRAVGSLSPLPSGRPDAPGH